MWKSITVSAAFALLAGCTTANNQPTGVESGPISPEAALQDYFASFPDDTLPVAPAGPSLNTGAPLSRIIVGSCHDEEIADPALQTIANAEADLFLMIGDNVYGDIDGRWYQNYDLSLRELRDSYADLAAAPEFQAVRASTPMMVTWDDHDYGMNDAGANFVARTFAERIYERFWGLEGEDLGQRPGVYTSKVFGPEGQRTQVIVLDTRFFRSDLTLTDAYGAPGKERYLDSTAAGQDMLGDAQWAWLEGELRKPADLRIIATSIQVTPDVHGWEAWDKLPDERQRLYDLIGETNANGVVFVSGDRHTAFLYRDAENGAYPFYELTASSLNKAFATEPDSAEIDAKQIGKGYAFTNFGQIDVDWDARNLTLAIRSEAGDMKRSVTVSFDEIHAGRK